VHRAQVDLVWPVGVAGVHVLHQGRAQLRDQLTQAGLEGIVIIQVWIGRAVVHRVQHSQAAGRAAACKPGDNPSIGTSSNQHIAHLGEKKRDPQVPSLHHQFSNDRLRA
jgi:hypothetical protein